jgi:hypothetical protein
LAQVSQVDQLNRFHPEPTLLAVPNSRPHAAFLAPDLSAAFARSTSGHWNAPRVDKVARRSLWGQRMNLDEIRQNRRIVSAARLSILLLLQILPAVSAEPDPAMSRTTKDALLKYR